MVLCTAVYLAENKSFAFLDSFLLETDGWSDAILKQLELEACTNTLGWEQGERAGRTEIQGPNIASYPNGQDSPSVLLLTVYLLKVPKISVPLDESERLEASQFLSHALQDV